MKAKLVKVSVLIAILCACLLWVSLRWLHFVYSPLIGMNKPAVKYVLRPGVSVKLLAKELHQKGILKDPTEFVWLIRLRGKARKLQAGEYYLTPGITSEQLMKKIIQGDVIKYPFIIIPGWNFTRLLKSLNDDSKINHKLYNLTTVAIMRRLGFAGQHPEGRFFPETYLFAKNSSDIAILQNAYKLMQTNLQNMWSNRAANLPYRNSYEALIVASIVEKETSLPQERPIIAGIIIRRLQKKMYLQLDPTVIYGLGKNFKGDLNKKNMRKNTPYNTYRHKGLPPTPICMPAAAAIYAALHPASGKELYFVAKGDGSHEFSENLEKHDKAIRKYQLPHPKEGI